MKRLRGTIRHYPWGDLKALATILGHTPTGEPEAEYWLGAHPADPSVVLDAAGHEDDPVTLDQLIAADTRRHLGPDVADQFGELPFLLKILGVAQPLSIQAHPSSRQAAAGFEREEAAGIPIDSPVRNYRDRSHKPELLCALTPVEAKCGFRSVAGLRHIASLFASPLLESFFSPVHDNDVADEAVIRGLVGDLLSRSDGEVESLVTELVDECRRLMASDQPALPRGVINQDELDRTLHWTLVARDHFGADVGVVMALLLNHIRLEPGQALYLDAGNVHAYLSGVGVELMANSDNVLRCGLTSKHVDPAELMVVADFEPRPPRIETAADPVHRFRTPAPEFSLVRLAAGPADGTEWLNCVANGPEILLVTGGGLVVDDDWPSLPDTQDDADSRPDAGLDTDAGSRGGRHQVRLESGQAVFRSAGDGRFRVRLDGSETVAWRATVGR